MSDTPDPPSRSGQVDGTTDPDIIDDQYTDDPEGDGVDGQAEGPSDVISAGAGEDTLEGGSGLDVMSGGTGNDTFYNVPTQPWTDARSQEFAGSSQHYYAQALRNNFGPAGSSLRDQQFLAISHL